MTPSAAAVCFMLHDADGVVPQNVPMTYEGYWITDYIGDWSVQSGVAGDRYVSFGNNHMIAHQTIAAPTMSFCIMMNWYVFPQSRDERVVI